MGTKSTKRMKLCGQCFNDLDLDQFYKRNNGKPYTICKICTAENQKEWVEKNRDKYNEYQRKYVKQNNDSVNFKRRANYKKNIEKRRQTQRDYHERKKKQDE